MWLRGLMAAQIYWGEGPHGFGGELVPADGMIGWLQTDWRPGLRKVGLSYVDHFEMWEVELERVPADDSAPFSHLRLHLPLYPSPDSTWIWLIDSIFHWEKAFQRYLQRKG